MLCIVGSKIAAARRLPLVLLSSTASLRRSVCAVGRRSLGAACGWQCLAERRLLAHLRFEPARPVAARGSGTMADGALPPPAAAAWDGAGLSQNEFMMKDECVLVDAADRVTGHASKWQAHRFEGDQPSGLLHRAFSVFLFDAAGRLLLQQRALSKITFPGVWTNTCCSHPLYGYTPTEVDGAALTRRHFTHSRAVASAAAARPAPAPAVATTRARAAKQGPTTWRWVASPAPHAPPCASWSMN